MDAPLEYGLAIWQLEAGDMPSENRSTATSATSDGSVSQAPGGSIKKHK
jgi:hypothetical protein